MTMTMTRTPASQLRVVMLVAFACAATMAYPDGFKGHGAPQEDSGTTFAVTNAFDAVVESLCPRAVYNLTNSFPSGGAELYLTASSGALGSPYNKACPNQAVAVAGSERDYVDTFSVDCSETGNITVMVTWSNSKRDYYHQSSVVLVLDETCKLDTWATTSDSTSTHAICDIYPMVPGDWYRRGGQFQVAVPPP
eukprot:gene12406-15597_t